MNEFICQPQLTWQSAAQDSSIKYVGMSKLTGALH